MVLNRIRIGHTRLTHGYLMEREARPTCDECEVELSIDHILFDEVNTTCLLNAWVTIVQLI